MNRDETKKILMMMENSFQNFHIKPEQMSFVIDMWTDDLSDLTYEQVYMALKSYKRTNTSGFAPTVGQLLEQLSFLTKSDERMNGNEAWALVYKAICNSTYKSREEFEKLPELVQKAVGSPDVLRTLASSSDFNEEVEKSHFIRIYDTAVKRENEVARLPESIRKAMSIAGSEGIGIEQKI